jgi:Sugar phosphate permease
MPLMSQEQHYSKTQLANIIFGYSLLYASGQFIFGLMADKFGSRRVVTVGLLTAVLSNFLLGLSTSASMLMVFACLNGAGQSTGWPGLVKNMALWFRHSERGVVMAWWTTNYVVGGFVGTLFATYVVTASWLFPSLGWRRGFLDSCSGVVCDCYCFLCAGPQSARGGGASGNCGKRWEACRLAIAKRPRKRLWGNDADLFSHAGRLGSVGRGDRRIIFKSHTILVHVLAPIISGGAIEIRPTRGRQYFVVV